MSKRHKGRKDIFTAKELKNMDYMQNCVYQKINKTNKDNFKDLFKFEPGTILCVSGPYGSGVDVCVLNKISELDLGKRTIFFDLKNIGNIKEYNLTTFAPEKPIDCIEEIENLLKIGACIFIIDGLQFKTIDEITDFVKKLENLKPLLKEKNATIVILDVLKEITDNKDNMPILAHYCAIDKRFIMVENK